MQVKKHAEKYKSLINLSRILSLYSSILCVTTRWFSSLTAVLLNAVFVWLGVILSFGLFCLFLAS
jgi:Ca2+-dependent lipid-binding protein